MSDDPPFIVPTDQPFKVQATPSKMGGVDALAKRPLDMTGQPQAWVDQREALATDTPSTESWVTLPSQVPSPDNRAMLASDTIGALGGEGPVLQDQIDTSHREYFDDPSRYLRTDVVVKLPSEQATRGATASPETDFSQAKPSGTSTPARARRGARGSAIGTALGSALAGPTPHLQAASSPRATAQPPLRRDEFNQRLASILSHQQQIHQELSAVEQAVQTTLARLDPGPALDPDTGQSPPDKP